MILELRNRVTDVLRFFAGYPGIELAVRFDATIEDGHPNVLIDHSAFRELAGEGNEARRRPRHWPELSEPWHFACQAKERVFHDLASDLPRHPERQEAESFREKPALVQVQLDVEAVKVGFKAFENVCVFSDRLRVQDYFQQRRLVFGTQRL